MFKFLAMVFIPKAKKNPLYIEEVSNEPSYWKAYWSTQQRIKKKYTKETGYDGVNVIVKRHKNEP